MVVWWIVWVRYECRTCTSCPSVFRIVLSNLPHSRSQSQNCIKLDTPATADTTNTPCSKYVWAIGLEWPTWCVVRDGQCTNDSFAMVFRFEHITNFECVSKLSYRRERIDPWPCVLHSCLNLCMCQSWTGTTSCHHVDTQLLCCDATVAGTVYFAYFAHATVAPPSLCRSLSRESVQVQVQVL